MRAITKEFQEFIMRGNVFDMAVGIIIGAAFGGIVNSLVNDVLMPPIGLLLTKVDFKTAEWPIKYEQVKKEDGSEAWRPKVAIKYGAFLNQVINFLIVGLVIFSLLKGVNRLKRKPPPPPPSSKECPFCMETIPLKAVKCGHCTSDIKAA